MVTKIIGSTSCNTSCSTTTNTVEQLKLADLCDVNVGALPTDGNLLIGNGLEFTTLDLSSQTARDAVALDLTELLNDYADNNAATPIFSCSLIDWTDCPAGTIDSAAINFTTATIPSSSIDFVGTSIPLSSITFTDDSLPATAIDWNTMTETQANEMIAQSNTAFDTGVTQDTLTGEISVQTPSGASTTLQTKSTDAGNLLLTGTDGGVYISEPIQQLP